jgi:hypothetical protein
MKRYLPLLVIAVFCGLVVLAVSHFSSKSVPDGRANPVAAESEPDASLPDASAPAGRALGANERTANEVVPPEARADRTLPRVQELERMELAKRQRDEAAAKMHQARAEVQLYRHNAWTKVIQDNYPQFQALREQAAQSSDKKVPCSICNARGVLDLCVVCDHTGKCPTCHGTGKVLEGVCPTCVGTGKCFLCLGLGKMPCPFCQSLPNAREVITPRTPDPPADFPIE